MEKKKISIDQLAVEITRWCNMSCAHCLRGDRQLVDISKNTIDNFLERVKEISTITFTGGEPACNVSGMRNFLAACRKRNIPVYGFYLVTNGKVVPDSFLRAVDEWDNYCMKCDYGKVSGSIKADEAIRVVSWMQQRIKDFMSGLALSLDEWHEPIPLKNIMRLMSRRAFVTDKMIKTGDSSLIYMGRATQMPEKCMDEISPAYYEHDYSTEQTDPAGGDIIEQLYLNAKGGLLYSCDLSYEKQEEFVYANVQEEDWVESLVKNSHRRYMEMAESYQGY